MKPYILALDQGTTSSRAILFDRRQQVVGCAQKEFTQIYPQAGWVEHDAEEIYGSQWEVLGRVLREAGISAAEVAAIGITHSDGLQTLAGKVSRGYGIFFTCLLYLTIGPCFAIPRCATTSFTTGIEPLLVNQISEKTALFIFSVIFFTLVLFFSLKPGNITLWIGKVINPLFLSNVTLKFLPEKIVSSSLSVCATTP